MRSPAQKIILFLKGIAMGSADVVPGVSGGTIAFITGIYEELINSIKSINFSNGKLLLQGKFKNFWSAVNGSFLLILVGGILLSLFSLARLISYALANHPIPLWSFFFGLIIISSVIILRHINKWNWGIVIGLIAGISIAFYITSEAPTSLPNGLFFVFLAGAIAICAMILPGISGSFILILLGKYEYIINAVRNINIPDLIVFAVGCIAGLLAFSRLISWTLQKFHNLTIAVLSGFMIGSLNKIWPWKKVVEYRINASGFQEPLFEQNVTPGEYLRITGEDPFVFHALLFAALGIFLVMAIDRLAHYMNAK